MTGREELTTRARVQDAALRLFAERGYHPTTIRQIAQRAGVSPALVIHHFGSKEGLRYAVDEDVLRELREPLQKVQPSNEPLEDQFVGPEEQFREIFVERPELGDYLRRMLIDQDDAGERVLIPIVEVAEAVLKRFEEQGIVRPTSDERMRAIMLTYIDLGVIILRPLLERHLGHAAWSPEVFGRWAATEFEILRDGVLIEPPETLNGERNES